MSALAPAEAVEEAARLTAVREALPTIVRGGYFNTGYTGPLCAAAQEAMLREGLREFETGRMGTAHRARREEVHAAARQAVADLLGAAPDEIALTHHTTEGLNALAHGLSWRQGANAVTTRLEHKGGILPLGVLARRQGVELRAVGTDAAAPPDDLVREVVAAIDARTQLVVVSHVLYVNGALLDLAPIADAAHRHGALLAVDGAQAAGVVPLDVKALGADAYTVSGQKWLCGPEDTGALYLDPAWLDRVAQTYVGWASVDTWGLDGSFTPNSDVTRFEVGTRSTPLVAGLAAAVRWLLDDVGLSWASERTCALVDLACEALRRAGTEVLTSGRHGGLVSFRTGRAPDELVAELGAAGTMVRSIFGYDCARASIGFFHTEHEVADLVQTISEAARR